METLKLSEKIALEKLLVAAGVKECDHRHRYEAHCFVCQKDLAKKD